MAFRTACPVLLCVVLSSVNSLELLYQPVEGDCLDLPAVHDYDSGKIASGTWYNQYNSYGHEGDSCATVHHVQRGNKNFIDFLIYDKEAKRYELYPDDIVYNPNRPGTYTKDDGAVVYMLTSDMLSFIYGYQCLEKNGKKRALVVFTTRNRKISDEEEKIYQNITARLAERKILPKMFKISHEDCPPEYKLKIENNKTEDL